MALLISGYYSGDSLTPARLGRGEPMTYQDFEKDLLEGKEAEHEVCFYCKHRWDKKAEVQNGKDKRKDVILPTLGKLLEVKYCPQAKEYRNIPVEYLDRGKESGILTSHANTWVYKVTNIFCFIPRTKLNELASNNELKNYETEPGHVMSLRIVSLNDLYKHSSLIIWDLNEAIKYTSYERINGFMPEDLRLRKGLLWQ